MCCRAQHPAQGQWTPPSGYLECGETLEAAAAREAFEETGIVIDPAKLELHAVINMTAIDQVAVAFRVEFSTIPTVTPGPECTAVEFLSEQELSQKPLAWRESIGDAPRRLFGEIRSGNFSIQLISIGSERGAGFKSRLYQLVASVPRPDTR
jgi:ADP-ribose pyrophosphatase